jgi:DNA-binding beta-propeller fold protein YncE
MRKGCTRPALALAAVMVFGLFGSEHLITSRVYAAATSLFTYWGVIGGSMGPGPDQMDHPVGIAVGPQDRIYVADTFNNRIKVYAADGTLQSTFGSTGSASGQFDYPSGISVDASGKILVVDSNNNRLQLFDANGVFVKSFGTLGNYEPSIPRTAIP